MFLVKARVNNGTRIGFACVPFLDEDSPHAPLRITKRIFEMKKYKYQIKTAKYNSKNSEILCELSFKAQDKSEYKQITENRKDQRASFATEPIDLELQHQFNIAWVETPTGNNNDCRLVVCQGSQT